ncbi:hypothetical protein GCM10020256_61890 [Streptomyces thermocoprophilus]
MCCGSAWRAGGWPLWPSAALTLLVVAPGIGVLLERFVFRPLSVLGGDPAQTLVASIGVFVLLVGGAAVLWGAGGAGRRSGAADVGAALGGSSGWFWRWRWRWAR